MNEEEKEAIKYFYNLRATIDESNMLFDEDINVKCGKKMIKQITIITNLIQKQQEEIESRQEKQVDKTTLLDFFMNSVDETQEPVWTEKHIDELLNNFEMRWK